MASRSPSPVGRSDDAIWPVPREMQSRLVRRSFPAVKVKKLIPFSSGQWKCIAFGSTGIIELLPCGRKIKKSPHPTVCSWQKITMRKELKREFEVYQRLPAHPRLVRMFGFCDNDDGERGLVFEYMPKGNLKDFLNSDAEIPMEQRLRWCVEAAEGVAHLHSHGIFHCDIKPESMVLDDELGIRIIDLSGASIDGKEPLALENPRFFLPRDVKEYAFCDVTTDLFALGSSFYQIITGKKPYEDVESQEAEARYTRKEFRPWPTSHSVILYRDVGWRDLDC